MSTRAQLALLWILAPVLLGLSLWRPADESAGRGERLAEEAGGWTVTKYHTVDDTMVSLLGTSDATWRTYAKEGAPPVYVIAVFHQSNWKALHPPRTCLVGSNMDIAREQERFGTTADGRNLPLGYLLMRSKDARGGHYLSFYAYVAPPDLVTGTYWDFFWHHLPRAILRRDIAGGLLRVETWVGGDGLAAAQERCWEVYSALIPNVQELLR